MIQERPLTDWLPITKKEVEDRGWSQLDVIIVSGDAYVDLNNDGEIEESEAEAFTRLDLFNFTYNISSLEGIQSFKNLETLNCSHHNLTEIDLSQNFVEKLPLGLFQNLKKLKKLNLQNNPICKIEETMLNNEN